jgi:hypothetical protein
MRARRGRKQPGSTWLGRLACRWRPDRNPLRRRSDRVETAVVGVLVAAFCVGAPFAAHVADNWTYTASLREQQAEMAAWHQVRATVVWTTPEMNGYASAAGTSPEVMARWKAPDGQVRTGLLYVIGGARAGGTFIVWTDRAGQLTSPPLQKSQIATRADLDEALAVAALAIVLLAVGGLAHRALDRYRLAAWGADWLATGPRWSPRR